MKKEDVKPYIFVKHFKHEFTTPEDEPLKYYYLIQALVENCTTGEKMVLYRALYGDNEYFVRTIDDFCKNVDRTKYPTVKQTEVFVKTDLP